MEDNFRVRVDKIFGSLSSASSSTVVSTNNLWSLTDEKVTRIKWNRDKDEVDTSERSPRIRLEELEDDIDELDHRGSIDDDYSDFRTTVIPKSHHHNSLFDRDEWEIRSSIGLDCTLDNEEEEDEFDKVAEGKGNSPDRLYLEDDGDDSTTTGPASSSFESLARPWVKPKPILKRKEGQKTESKSGKRVRFDPNCTGGGGDGCLPLSVSAAPDYIRNPSKYTCYTLDDDAGEDDGTSDESNRKAYSDFLKVVPNVAAEVLTAEIPTSLSFIPRKRTLTVHDGDGKGGRGDATGSCMTSARARAHALVMATMDGEESEVCAMEEDAAHGFGGNGGAQSGRRYRIRTRHDSEI